MAYPEAPTSSEFRSGGFIEAVEQFLSLQPDLIIEGATGSRPTLKNAIEYFYIGPYIGLDINDEIITRNGFTRHGNCVLPNSVTPIISEFYSQRPALVTWHGLPAILSDRISHEDRKDKVDILSEKTIVSNITQLYKVQMHIFYDVLLTSNTFFQECINKGWQLFDYNQIPENAELRIVIMTHN